jgi:hypothetical protein
VREMDQPCIWQDHETEAHVPCGIGQLDLLVKSKALEPVGTSDASPAAAQPTWCMDKDLTLQAGSMHPANTPDIIERQHGPVANEPRLRLHCIADLILLGRIEPAPEVDDEVGPSVAVCMCGSTAVCIVKTRWTVT